MPVTDFWAVGRIHPIKPRVLLCALSIHQRLLLLPPAARPPPCTHTHHPGAGYVVPQGDGVDARVGRDGGVRGEDPQWGGTPAAAAALIVPISLIQQPRPVDPHRTSQAEMVQDDVSVGVRVSVGWEVPAAQRFDVKNHCF